MRADDVDRDAMRRRGRTPTVGSAGLSVVAGLGTALVLTGGNLYMAHTLATAKRWRSLPGRRLDNPGLLRPTGPHDRGRPERSHAARSPRLSGAARELAVLAAVAHEVTAAVCMLASASLVAGSRQPQRAEPADPAWRAGWQLAGSLAARGSACGTAAPLPHRLRQVDPVRRRRRHLRHCPARLKRQTALLDPAAVRRSLMEGTWADKRVPLHTARTQGRGRRSQSEPPAKTERVAARWAADDHVVYEPQSQVPRRDIHLASQIPVFRTWPRVATRMSVKEDDAISCCKERLPKDYAWINRCALPRSAEELPIREEAIVVVKEECPGTLLLQIAVPQVKVRHDLWR